MDETIFDEVKGVRVSKYQTPPLFLNRWSPRSMTGEPLSDDELFSLFEAARWAPSSYNSQPWRILYAKRDTPEWDLFYNLMIEFNQTWTQHAAALIVMISRKTFEKNGKPSVTHSYDTGAAWMSLALAGHLQGLVVHGMSGFDYEKARQDLNIPDEYQVEAMAAVGKRAPKENLPDEIQKMEAPSDRLPLEKTVIHGRFRD